MRLKLIKEYSSEEKSNLRHEISISYGSLEKLRQRTARGGCRDPVMVDDFMIHQALEKGATYQYEKVIPTVDAMASLTPKRVELINFIRLNEVSSIMGLSKALDRDYKNVYDDLMALERNGVMEFSKEGKNRKPLLKADRIVIEFG